MKSGDNQKVYVKKYEKNLMYCLIYSAYCE